MNDRRIAIGSRGSVLALVQSEWVAARLRELEPGLEVVIEKISTTGDRILDAPLAKIGDKGLFTKELEVALLDGRIDLAVHSAKDMPTAVPEGLTIGAFTRREDVRDAFVGLRQETPGAAAFTVGGQAVGGEDAVGEDRQRALVELPHGARVGSSSLRRRSQLLALRPDLRLVDLRGNVQTRLRKLHDERLDGTVLAAAGLLRLGRTDLISFIFGFDQMLPAVGQGALAIEMRTGDERVSALVSRLDHAPTSTAVRAERALLARLEGGCQIPIGAHGELTAAAGGVTGSPPADDAAASRGAAAGDGERLVLQAYVGSLDGALAVRDTLAGAPAAPAALGACHAARLIAAGAGRILDQLRGAQGDQPAPGSAR